MIERVIAWLIPCASREEVLGDLRERCGPRFVFEALVLVPFVVASRVRRITDPVILVMEALALFTSFALAAAWLNHALLFEPWGLARMEVPVAIVLVTMVVDDAYADPKKRPPLRPMAAPVLGMALAAASLALPRDVMIWGGMIGTGVVISLRFFFPPLADRAQAAKIPAHWQKLEMDAVNLAAARFLLPVVAALVFLLIALAAHWQKLEMDPVNLTRPRWLLAVLVFLLIALARS